MFVLAARTATANTSDPNYVGCILHGNLRRSQRTNRKSAGSALVLPLAHD